MLRTQLHFVFALALLLCTQHALASPTQFFWDNASGGDYATPGNWSPSGPPTDLDDAYFNLSSSGYDVDVSAPTIAREVVVQNDSVNFEIDISLSVNTVVVGDQAGQTGNLTVKSGSLESGYTTIGNAAGSQGTLTVDGTAGAATYSSSVDLIVGASGDGTLHVKAGGQAKLADVAIGAGGVGQITVSGAGSSLTSSGTPLEVGTSASGSGTLLVENGATSKAQAIRMGTVAGSSGIITVTGAGSKLDAVGNSAMTIGDRGDATLHVLDGGTVTHFTQDVILGRFSPGSGSVVVDGAGSLFSTASHVNVGGRNIPFQGAGGNGTLSVSNGGTFTMSGLMFVSSRGLVDVQGGTLNVGDTVANFGTVHLNGTINGDFSNSGLLTGEGTINGELVIGGTSTLSPGNSPGTLTAGDTRWSGNGLLKFEIDSALGTAGENWDLLNVTGALDFNVTEQDFLIDLTSLLPDGSAGALSDFDPSQDYAWTFAKAAGGITNFATENFTVLTGNFGNSFDHYFSVIQVGNELQLLYSVPEPSTMVSGAIGLALLLGAVHKRRRMRDR